MIQQVVMELIMRRLSTLLLFLSGISCTKQKDLDRSDSVQGSFIIYTIPKGGHYALQTKYKAFNGSALNYTVRFDSSAIYYSGDPENQADINKLFGFSENNDHHETSARFGWNWNGDKVALYAYCYADGIRSITPLASVDINKEYFCSIKLTHNNYEFTVADSSNIISRTSYGSIAIGHHLYPYFGGDETAPHDIYIFLRPE